MGFYQFSFDDMEFAEALAKQPGKTAFIDECGSFGFDFEKDGVSSHYIVCSVVINNNVRICSSTQFVYSGELVQHLSQISEKKVTKDYLYRRIIAPLRDEGVIIASSVHGYKIPTSVEDIRTYINQTVTVVGPMLSRIGKCRVLIKKQTDSKLDILEDPSLLGYQRYFGDY